MLKNIDAKCLPLSVTKGFLRLTSKVFLCTNHLKFLNNSINVYSTKYQSENMQRSNRTELCDATRKKKQSGFETHLGSDAIQCFCLKLLCLNHLNVLKSAVTVIYLVI